MKGVFHTEKTPAFLMHETPGVLDSKTEVRMKYADKESQSLTMFSVPDLRS